jgi:large subunit ribosomal protein L19
MIMNKQAILQYVDQKFTKKEHADFRVGDQVRVHVKIVEGDTARVQVFEGVVISMKGHGGARAFTVRKVSFGVGVERSFPLNSPSIDKVEIVRSGHVRRSKLYYLRDRQGKAARLEEKETAASEARKAASNKPAAPVAKPQEALVVAEEK